MGQRHSGGGACTSDGISSGDAGGGAASGSESLLTESFTTLGREIRKHANIFKDTNTLEYDDFVISLDALNRLSAGCLDPDGMRMVFIVQQGTDQSPLWRVTTRIVCIRVNQVTRRIDRHQVLSLRQFNNVFRTIQGHVSVRSEAQLDRVICMATDDDTPPDGKDHDDLECIICMDRKPDVSLPCAHYYCFPCIQQWKESHNTCPLCQQVMSHEDDSWVLTEHPDVQEVNDRIRSELMGLADSSSDSN